MEAPDLGAEVLRSGVPPTLFLKVKTDYFCIWPSSGATGGCRAHRDFVSFLILTKIPNLCILIPFRPI